VRNGCQFCSACVASLIFLSCQSGIHFWVAGGSDFLNKLKDTAASQLFFKLVIFSFEIADEGYIVANVCFTGEHIPAGRSLYVFGSICIDQTVMGLFPICWKWWNVNNERCPAVASQRLLQQSCQLALTIRHKNIFGGRWRICQNLDTVSKCEQGFIYFCPLYLSCPFLPSRSFRPR
jgi:hypothetical protein